MRKKIDENIRILCEDCRTKMYTDNGKFTEAQLRKSKMVKAMFIENGKMAEHMWIKTKQVVNDNGVLHVKGTLYNDPFQLTNIKFGDVVIVSASKIEDVRNSLK